LKLIQRKKYSKNGHSYIAGKSVDENFDEENGARAIPGPGPDPGKRGHDMGEKDTDRFDRFFREIVHRTCAEWNYPVPGEEYFSKVYRRLPPGLRSMISLGLSRGLIREVARSKTGAAAFRPIGVPDSKGPYSFFEKDKERRQPNPCREYLVQLAEYIRLYEAIEGKGFEIRFEDDLMDIAIYDGQRLLVCYEVKEQSSVAGRSVQEIKRYGEQKVLPKKVRGDDALQKAHYLVKHKPEYFSVVSIGRRFEFKVEYPPDKQFQLIEDLTPIL
jgi:hypothetical protein